MRKKFKKLLYELYKILFCYYFKKLLLIYLSLTYIIHVLFNSVEKKLILTYPDKDTFSPYIICLPSSMYKLHIDTPTCKEEPYTYKQQHTCDL